MRRRSSHEFPAGSSRSRLPTTSTAHFGADRGFRNLVPSRKNTASVRRWTSAMLLLSRSPREPHRTIPEMRTDLGRLLSKAIAPRPKLIILAEVEGFTCEEHRRHALHSIGHGLDAMHMPAERCANRIRGDES